MGGGGKHKSASSPAAPSSDPSGHLLPAGEKGSRRVRQSPFSPREKVPGRADEGATPTKPNRLFAIRYSLFATNYPLLTHLNSPQTSPP
ncbi:hypothetical protein F2982_03615 [Rhizobium sp. BG4]|nr:hypothetical protein F2982_03615 [Rhizobium sp. BG4]